MGATGSHLARLMRWRAVPYFRAYRDHVVHDALAGFSNLDERAEAFAEEVYDAFMATPAADDPDCDPSPFAESAREHGLAFYEAMSGLRQATINLLAAGLFHGLEQHLAFLCGDSAFSDVEPDDRSLGGLQKWYLEQFDLDLTRFPQWAAVDELRLVANAVKHAEGRSAEALRQRRPDLFQDPCLADLHGLSTRRAERPLRLPLAGADLFVTEEACRRYAVAACAFVEGIEHFFEEAGTMWFPVR